MPAVFFLQGEEQNFVERKKRNGYNYLKGKCVKKTGQEETGGGRRMFLH